MARRDQWIRGAPQYCITYLRDSRPPTLAVEGEIDLAARDDLIGAGRLASFGSDTSLRVDLGGVTFLDGHGGWALLELQSLLLSRGVASTFENAPPCVDRVFELMDVRPLVTGGYEHN